MLSTLVQYQNVSEAVEGILKVPNRPKEVGAKLERVEGELWLHLYSTKNGRWHGSGRWVSIRIEFEQIGQFLGTSLPALGVRLEQTDFRELHAVLDYVGSLGFNPVSYRDRGFDDYQLYAIVVQNFLYSCRDMKRRSSN